ncbi:helix-turn-helix transcriptional regulator [Thioclava sp. FR2]|uniref:helix-turn-helix transcriptional regulator n=1 Tax=Thioclava sp. FR2 TaxID=3445780 RepID=UPI003EB78F0C
MLKDRIIRLPEVLKRTGFSRSSWYRAMRDDPEFPKPIPLGQRSIGFAESDIDRLIERLLSKRHG